MTPSPQSRLISNTLWNGIGRMAMVATGLFLTPYLLARVGQEGFGLWALANLLIGYFSLADLGIQSSLVRQIAYARPDRNPEKLSEIISTSFFFYLGAFVVLGPVATLLGPWLVRALRDLRPGAVPDHMFEEGTFVVTFVGATLFLSIALTVFTSILPGIQRMDRANQLVIITSLANVGAVVFVLEKGWGVSGLVVASIVVKLVSALMNHQLSRRLCPSLELALRHVKWPVWKELFSFGWKMQVARLCEILTFGFDRVLLSLFGGVAALGRYQPAVQVGTQARILPHLLVTAALPYASDLSARRDREALLTLYFEGTRFLAFVSFAVLGFVILAAPFLTSAWLGPGYEDVAVWIRIFCAGYLVTAPLSLGGLISQAIGRPGIQARSALFGTALTLVLSPAGLWIGGVTGLAVGSSLAVVGAGVWFLLAMNMALEVSTSEVIRRCCLRPALFVLGPAFSLAIVGHPLAHIAASRSQALLAVLVAAVLFAVPCLWGLRSMDLLNIRTRLGDASFSS